MQALTEMTLLCIFIHPELIGNFLDLLHENCGIFLQLFKFFLLFFRPKGIYSKLLRHMETSNLMMQSRIDGVELLLFSSTILPADSQSEHHKFCNTDLMLFHDKFVY